MTTGYAKNPRKPVPMSQGLCNVPISPQGIQGHHMTTVMWYQMGKVGDFHKYLPRCLLSHVMSMVTLGKTDSCEIILIPFSWHFHSQISPHWYCSDLRGSAAQQHQLCLLQTGSSSTFMHLTECIEHLTKNLINIQHVQRR